MQKLMRNTITLMLAVIFLVSFTGLRLLLHHCMGCNISDYSLLTSVESCCSATPEHQACTATLAISCCSSTSGENNTCDDCCQDEVIYLKNDYQLVNAQQENRIEPVELSVPAAIFLMAEMELPETKFTSGNHAHDPPPMLTGRDFIIFSHQLKVS
jgi:hypothetical protein